MRLAGALLLIGGTLPPVALAGGATHIAVPECGIDGDAEALAVGPCPPVRSCPPGYATVTATFRHVVSGVWDVAVEGEADPLGVTGNHPVWSEDRRAFVRADGLGIGERLLNAADEAVRVTAAGPRGPPAGDAAAGGTAVFNIEVHGAHVYRVGGGGLLVHNGVPCFEEGAFSIIPRTWDDYPTGHGLTRPTGPFKILEGAEYEAARGLANRTNRNIRSRLRRRGVSMDFEIHEIHPVKFGGSPTDPFNKVFLPRDFHRQQVTPWWNNFQRMVTGPR